MNLAALAADALLVLHALFIGFVVFGAAAVARWPRLAWLHLPALAWGIWIEASAGICPLTIWEDRLRLQAGQAAPGGVAPGFVERHLGALVYPQGLTPGTQLGLALALAAFNLLLYAWLLRRRRARRQSAARPAPAPRAGGRPG